MDINKILTDFNIADQHFVDVIITECGREQCVPQKHVSPGKKPHYCFHMINNGHGVFIQNGVSYKLKGGDVFLIFPGETVEYFPDKNDPWGYTWVGFKGLQADRCAELCGFTRENPVYTTVKDSAIRERFSGLFESYTDYNFVNLMTMGQLYELFFLFQQERRELGEKKLTQKEKHIRDAIIFIYYNYHFDISVKDIAGSLNLNINYLCNIFNEVLGISPKKCIIHFRMKRAQDILNTTKYKIKDVASMVGYEDQLHFSKEFKKYFGLSPKEYCLNKKHTEEN